MFWCFDISRHSVMLYSQYLSKLGKILMNFRKKFNTVQYEAQHSLRLISEYINHLQKDNSHLHICRIT